ncbi:hypothetical protein GCM10027589_12710 [Actinocorallia lasiicapitis]
MSTSHAGRPRSWVGVGVVFLGFLLGGIALVTGPLWILFWIGVAVAVLGGLGMLLGGVFNDVVLSEPIDGGPRKDLEESTGRPTRRDAGEGVHG